jgi:cobaltochelatase CobN
VPERETAAGTGPTVAVLYYRAQQLAGNTAYIEALCDAIERAGGRPLPVYCTSLRTPEPELLELLATADAMVVTVLAAGGAPPATVGAGGDDDGWDVKHLAALDVPILQGLCLTSSRSKWAANDDGLSPLDVATQVAVPEFDGRIITVPFSFKEIDADGLISYVPDPERCARGRPGGQPRQPAPGRRTGQAAGAGVLGLPDEALAHRQRGRPGHPGQCAGAAGRPARRRLRHRRGARAGGRRW